MVSVSVKTNLYFSVFDLLKLTLHTGFSSTEVRKRMAGPLAPQVPQLRRVCGTCGANCRLFGAGNVLQYVNVWYNP